MGGNQSKIITKDVPYEEIKASSPIQVTKFCPPFRKYKNQYRKQNGRDLQVSVEVEEPQSQKIAYSQQLFIDMQDAFQSKTKNIQIEAVLFDEHYMDRKIYLAKQNGKELAIQIRPFSNFNTHAFNNILYQLQMNKSISQFNSQYLNTVVDSYAIQTGLEIQGEQFPNSEVFVMAPIATNLSEIIKYRKLNNWNWTTNQFNVLATDLCKAVKTLHENNISHNDIRPFNVFYSLDKNCYQLGGFTNAVRKVPSDKFNMVRTSVFFGAPQLEAQKNVDLNQADIYSLGMTLLCAFYLCEPIDRKGATPYNRKYEDKYKIMKVIRQMIMPIDRRSNLEKIMANIQAGEPSPKMKTLIQSLRYKNAPKDRKLIETKKALSEGYQRLGLWNEWRNNLNQAYQLEQNTLDDYKKATSLSQLARIQSCRGDPQNSNQYAKKSSKIFRNLGYAAYDQGNINEAVSLFSKAIQTSKYFENQNDIDLAKNLQGLALAHSQKGDYEVAKPLISQSANIVQKNNGKDSLDFCKIKISQAQIQSDFGQFQSAERILNECLNIADSKAKINQQLGQQLKAQILHDSGRNLMMQSSYDENNSKSESLVRAQKNIAQALQINQKFPDNHVALASNIETYGEIQMRKGGYMEARNHFRKAQLMRSTYLKQNNRVGTMQKQRADNLCHIAACETEMSEYPQALKTYNSALDIYRKLYGSDHNKLSGIAIGNMSKVYFKLGQKIKARECVQLATEIIEDVSGVEDPDYEHFKYLQGTLKD